MKLTIPCPRPFCRGRVFVDAILTERGTSGGYEAKCLACSRVFDLKKAVRRLMAAA